MPAFQATSGITLPGIKVLRDAMDADPAHAGRFAFGTSSGHVFLTRDRGKKRGVAKGARRAKSRFTGALEPMTRELPYAASKGAIDTFTVGLAREVATEGVRVNGVRPGIIDTEIHASGGMADRAQQSLHMIPMQRAGRAEEIAQAIVWLLSDEASYATGTLVDVSGGLLFSVIAAVESGVDAVVIMGGLHHVHPRLDAALDEELRRVVLPLEGAGDGVGVVAPAEDALVGAGKGGRGFHALVRIDAVEGDLVT